MATSAASLNLATQARRLYTEHLVRGITKQDLAVTARVLGALADALDREADRED